jgi:hypothetical protein
MLSHGIAILILSDTIPRLATYLILYRCALFIQDNTSGLYYKTITIVIYNCNDSGQYYNTRITIVIDDTSLSLCRQLRL